MKPPRYTVGVGEIIYICIIILYTDIYCEDSPPYSIVIYMGTEVTPYRHTVLGICQKERNTNGKFVSSFLIRNVTHFYGLPLDLCGKRIAVLFAQCAAILREKHRNP